MSKVNFRTSGYFPWYIVFIGVLIGIIGGVVLFSSWTWGAIMLLASIMIFTTHYRLEVDLQNKTYHDYLMIMGFRSGEKGRFNAIEYVFIRKGHITQKMNSRVYSTIVRKQVFDGYLKFSEENKMHLLSMESKESLTNRLKTIARQLNVKIVDYSDGLPRQL